MIKSNTPLLSQSNCTELEAYSCFSIQQPGGCVVSGGNGDVVISKSSLTIPYLTLSSALVGGTKGLGVVVVP